MKKLHLDIPKCVGCKLCELACSFAHYKMFSHAVSNVNIHAVEDTCDFTPNVCVQCEERSCVDACPMVALSIDAETGAIVVDNDACIFCEACIGVCNTNGLRVIEYGGEQKLAVCDLCGGKELPRCATVCRENAINLVEVT